MQNLKPEEIVHVKGDVINYRGRKQMKVNQVRLAKPKTIYQLKILLMEHL